MKKGLFLFVALLVVSIFVEFHPAVQQGRYIVPEKVYVGEDCGCDCISVSRPWYSTLNIWLWFMLFIVPFLVFSIPKGISKWRKFTYFLIITFVCYISLDFGSYLAWDISNGPFVGDLELPDLKTHSMIECANIEDGASRVFAVFFGWIPAGVYVVFWFLIGVAVRFMLSRLSFLQKS